MYNKGKKIVEKNKFPYSIKKGYATNLKYF